MIGKKTITRNMRFTCWITILMALGLISLCMTAQAETAANSNAAIRNVHVDPIMLKPGGKVTISFQLTRNAAVTVLIYSPDYDLVREIITGQPKLAGVNSITWDGHDENGNMVPSEAYLVKIIAIDDRGQETVYDPTTFSGGDVLYINIDKIEQHNRQYQIRYSVPIPARISVRAGIHKGPMLKTIVDWKPIAPGTYIQPWDGYDEGKRIHVMNKPGSHVFIKAFKLPENAIIVEGSADDYLAYHRQIRIRKKSADSTPLSLPRVKERALSRKDAEISSQYLVRRAFNKAPRFKVFLGDQKETGLAEKEVSKVSGDFTFSIEIDEESLQNFNESRYEILVFVDDGRFDEEEQAYSPYMYTLDTSSLANGLHTITVNMAGLMGQVRSYSFVIDVNN